MTAAALTLALAVGSVVWMLGRAAGVLYLVLWILSTVPGWALGAVAFGRRHAISWIAGGLVGYAATSVAFATAIEAGFHSGTAFIVVWLLLNGITWPLLWLRPTPLVSLPRWTRADTTALCLVLLTVPLLTGVAFRNVGAVDPDGGRNYRAYFTADFLWHEALTSELTRFTLPPGNPYLASERLHYYWTYFVPPAAALGAAPRRWGLQLEPVLLINAVGAGLLFMGMLFAAAWAVVPRAGPAAAATLVAVLAASAEGAYALGVIWRDGQQLDVVKDLNIDAITMWWFQGLTIDGLQRSLWYVPQHAGACALGLVALVAAGRAPERATWRSALVAGIALGLAVTFSPFLGGVMGLVYGGAVVLGRLTAPRALLQSALVQVVSVALLALGVLWCVTNAMLEGAGGAVHVGFVGLARHASVVTLLLALGPLLALVLPGVVLAVRRRTGWSGVAGLAVGLSAFFLVSLPGRDPVWVGWRAGQIILVTSPALAALTVAWLIDRAGRLLTGVTLAALFLVGLPTVIIDTYNAQDVSNRRMGPGFHWTVTITPGEQEAFRWIGAATPRHAIVQPDVLARDRETWTHIPTFAARRMAAGLPISLLIDETYTSAAERIHQMFQTTSPDEAYGIAREYRIDYVFVGAVERQSASEDALRKFGAAPEYFDKVFANPDVTIYAVARSLEFNSRPEIP